MQKRKLNNIRFSAPTYDYAEQSDATRVAPVVPQNIVRNVTESSINRPSLSERRRRVEEEQRNAELAEAARKAKDEAELRAKENAEYYRKRNEERKRQREEEDAQRKKQNEENERNREREREAWMKDVELHPENYSLADRDFLKVKKITDKIAKSIPALGTSLSVIKFGAGLISAGALKWFDVKDELGTGVLNSISINGENIQSRIGFAKLKDKMADAHEYMLDMQEAIDNVTKERDEFMRNNGYNPEIAALHPERYADLTKQVEDYNTTIGSLKNQIASDPYVKKLDDAYKQIYSIRHAGLGLTLKNIDTAIRDQYTYDQYKQYVQDKRADEQLRLYDNTLKQRHSDLSGYVNDLDRRLDQYEELSKYKTDQFDDQVQKMRDIKNMSLKEFERKEIQNFRGNIQKEIEGLRKDYLENRKHLAESTEYWDVRESYKNGQALNQNASMWSKEYWKYEVPGMIGSSASSEALGRSMAILLGSAAIGAVAAAVGLGFLSEPIIFAGQVISTPDDLKAVEDENYGETGMKRLDNILASLDDKSLFDEDGKNRVMQDLKAKSYARWKAQGLSDDYLREYLYGQEGDKNVLRDLFAGVIATNDPRMLRAMVQSTLGLQAQLDADNFRTGFETGVLKLMMLPGWGNVKRGVSTAIDKLGTSMSERVATEAVTDAAGKATTSAAASVGRTSERSSKYANGFRRTSKTLSESITAGYKQGAVAADALGLGGAGAVVVGAATGAARGTLHTIAEMSPKARRAIDGFTDAAMRKYQSVYDKLMSTPEWAKVAIKYGVRTAKATAASAASEAAEEAVQYLNEKEDFASKYGWDHMSWFDRAYNDIRQGGRVINSYLSLLGITESELKDDQEYWANVKGGFVLGGGHTAVMSAAGNIAGANNEIRIANALIESSVFNREASKINRAQYTEFARQAMAGKTNQVIDYVHRMETLDARRTEPEYTQEEYDEHIRSIREINAMSKDKALQKKLEDSGLVYGTEEYATALADIYNLRQQARENVKQRQEGFGNMTLEYNTKEYNTAIQTAVDNIIADREDLRDATDEQRLVERTNLIAQTKAGVAVTTRLKALINLKSQISSLDDMYKLMSDKFGVKPMRPDAKTIKKSIDSLIETAISDMKELDPGFDAKTDKDILDYIESIVAPISGIDYENLVLQEQHNALLNADAQVINSYQDQVGKKEYSRRIGAIMDANKRNAQLDWMVNDIFEGDAVTMLMSTLLEEAEQQSTKDEKAAQNEDKEASEPFDSKPAARREKIESAFAENKRKYEERKTKAKERYQRRKNRYKNWKRGNLNALIIPGQDAILAGANELVKYAEQGVYKFAQLIEDLKDITNNSDLSDVMSDLKRIYIKQRARLAMKNPEALSNMDSAEAINTFSYQAPETDPGSPDVPVSPLHQEMLKRIDEDSEKIIDSITSHYDVFVQDGDEVVIYKNIQAIEDSNLTLEKNLEFKSRVEKLVAANVSDESFKSAVIQMSSVIPGFPVDEYVKYRNTDGIEEAIARNIMRWAKGQDVLNGIKTQHAVTAVLLGRENTINPSIYPSNLPQFIHDVTEVKNNLEGLGLVILNTAKYLYGKDRNGNNIAVQADIIAADSKNKIYAIDVRASKESVLSNFDTNYGQRRSKRGQTEALLKQVDEIIRDKFKKPVTGLYLLPVVYNDYTSSGIMLERNNGRALYPIKMTKRPLYSDNIEELKAQARQMVDDINQHIREYNSYIEEANKYIDKFQIKAELLLQDYSTVEEYSLYMDNIRSEYDDIVEQTNLVALEIQRNIDIESNIFIENLESSPIEDIDVDVQVHITRLEDACSDLDSALRLIPLGKITTLEERLNVNKIYVALFEAQKRLDEALQKPEMAGIDITKEEELIAAAMEEIASHPESFGSAAIFMQRWWLNNFIIGSRSNSGVRVKSEAEQYAGYVNTIRSWIDTLHNHVVGELDNHRQLLIWYSTLLNNYFSKLLENARAFAETLDPTIKNAISIIAAKGDYLILLFNDTWGAPTDENFDGEPVDEVDRINRMPVKWTDLYGSSMNHSPAVDAMSINDQYFWMSNQPGFSTGAVVRFYISSRGTKYVNQRTGDSYEIKPGDVAVYIEYKDVNGKKQFADLPLFTNPNSYRNATPGLIARIAQLNRGNVRFEEKIRAMLDYIKSNPDYTIYTPISTNKGSINYSPIGDVHNVSEFLFANNLNQHNLYSIEVSAKDGVGILAVVDNKITGTKFYDVRTGSNLRHLANYNDVYQKGDMNVQSGLLIYMYNTNDGLKIGVPMPTSTIGMDDAAKLVFLIHQYLSGVRQYDGYDVLNLLKQRLYIRDPKKYHTVYNKEGNMITFEANGVNIGGLFYNIVSDKQKLIERISQMSNVSDVEILNQQLLNTNNGVFEVAYRKVKQSGSSVTLPNGFKLTLDDFEHDGKGSTMLGYMMRNGIVHTRAIGTGYKQINFGNPVLVHKDNVPGTLIKSTAAPTTQVKSPIEDNDPFTFDFSKLNGKLKMTIDPSATVNRTEEELDDFKKAVSDYMLKVLGENTGTVVFDEHVDEAMTMASSTSVSVGVTTTSLIEISRYAPDAVAPHESFHKILELLLPDEQREQFYKMYKEHEPNGRISDSRAIAEGLCDLFVDYTTGVTDAKNAPWYKKFFKWCDILKFLCGTAWTFGPRNTWKMFMFWRNINAGKYADKKYQMTPERIARFEKLFPGGLHYTVQNNTNKHTANLQYIADSGQLQQMVRALGYYIMEQKKISEVDPDITNFKIDDTTPNLLLAEDENGNTIMDNLCGTNLPEDQITVKHLAFREIFESRDLDVFDNKGKKVATTKVYPNFDAISNKVADYIGLVCGEYTGKVQLQDEDEESDMGENFDVQNLNIDKYDKASYEINKLEGTTKRVKLFFATIPYTTRDEHGKIVLDTTRNIFGTPTYMPIDEVYNVLVNDLHDVKSIKELYDKLKKLALVNTMHYMVLAKLHDLVQSIYTTDSDGNLTIDYDAEQFAIQIVNTISSQKMDFIIASSKTLKGGKGKLINITQSSLGRDTRLLPNQWTKFLLSGQVDVFARSRDKNGNIQFKDGKLYPNHTDIFSDTVRFVEEMREALSMSGVKAIGGDLYNVDSLGDIAKLKLEFVNRLHRIGIMISVGAIDHLLLNNPSLGTRVEDRDLGKGGMLAWLTLNDNTSVNAFLNKIAGFVYPNGTINQRSVKEGYSEIGFVKDLAKWLSAYNRITVDNRTLALNGKELHSISLNNAITRTLDALNTQDLNNPLIRTLTGFGFNLVSGIKPTGSIILKNIVKHNPNQQLVGHTYIGFKTDNKGDTGSEYTEEATVDDYMAKLSMLLEGYMIFPTLADKGTWMVVSGVDIPGMKFSRVSKIEEINGIETKVEKTVVKDAPSVRFYNKMPYIVPSRTQLDLMIEYATTERLAIQRCMADLGYKDIPGYEDEGRQPISESAKVLNYHTANKGVEPNGTRFLGLTLITVKEDGKFKTYNLNDPSKSSVELLKLANDLFFSKDPDTLADIMATTLHAQNSAEIDAAVSLGIVEHQTIKGEWNNSRGEAVKQEFSANLKTYYTLNSKFLNQDQIEALTSEFMKTLPHNEFGTWANIPNNFTGDNQKYVSRAKDLKAEKDFRYRTARGLAIAAILNDVTIRHIICSEESLRCFIGHPGFFKVRYGKNAIVDSAYDIQKRIGGLISTGEDNITRLPGIPETYIVAECNDYEVASTSNIAPNLEQMFIENSVREMYAIKTGKWKYAYKKPIEEIYEEANKKEFSIGSAINKAKENGQKFAKSFTKGINVADGAAYITDTMCENLLRMRGAYNDAVKTAFETLRSGSSWLQKRDAYKTIYDAVNIVPYKYTAYGFREHILNGELISDIAVPYYDKFALFPIFPDIATGNLGSIYQKMKNEGVDELLMTSAVKVGSQGAVSYNGSSIESKFNKYEQSFADIRRQLNTDPEEGDRITAGTQMIKIALQNLRLQRDNYIDVRTGENVSGIDLRNRLMRSINQLAIDGALEIRDMFCKENTSVVDPEKLSKYLNEQLGSRNASKAITDLIQVTEDEEGNKRLVGPLAATTDSSWIESIVISTVNKRVIDITTPGSSFTQRSVFAIEGKGEDGEGLILGDGTMSKTINNGEKLLMINEDGSMDAVITMDYFDEVLFKDKLSNLSFEEKRKWLFDHGVIGKGAKANTIGYRIPTQAQSSIHALRFVDVMPVGKASIILPEEFTKITGSDFDIDHLYLASYNYNIITDLVSGELTATTTFNPAEDGKFDAKYHQNNILDVLMTLLKDTDNSINSLYKSIDNDTELITSIADQVPEEGSTKALPYNFGTLHELVIRKNDYITGKTGIGPFALNVTNLELTRLFGVSFKYTKFAEATGIYSFDNIIDNNDNYVSSWLSAFINAHVDIVKDPYISKLNVNPYTYNMLNLLVRSGYGDTALWFIAQPIIRDMAAASSRAKSLYTRDTEKAKSIWAAEEIAVGEAISKYLGEQDLAPEIIDKYTKTKNPRDIQVRINTVKWMRDHGNVLAEIVKNPGATNVTVNGVEYNVKNVQKTIFYTWKTLESRSIALSNMVQHTKIDTRKHGKDLISINVYKDGYRKLFHPVDPDTSLWDTNSLRNLERNSWIGVKTDLAIAMPSLILGDQTFNANPEFIKAVFDFGNSLKVDGGVLNKEALKLIARSLITAVKSKYFVTYTQQNLCKPGQDVSEYMRSLVIGPNNMNSRLTRLKNLIETNPVYARLANNHLINQIYAEIEEEPTFAFGRKVERPAFVTILNNVDNSRVNSELLMDGWEDLLRDEDKFVRKFANDLIIYSFITSGEFKGWNKMLKYVPTSWLLGKYNPGQQSYVEYINQALKSKAGDYSIYLRDIIANNAMDSKLVRKVPVENSDGTENFIDHNTIIKIGKAVDSSRDAEKYILVRQGAGYNISDYNLYERIDYLGDPMGRSLMPIYVRIKKKGYHTGGYDIYEYGWSLGYGENENDNLIKFDVESAVAKAASFVENVDADTAAEAIKNVYLGKTEPIDTTSFEYRLNRVRANATRSRVQPSILDRWERDNAKGWSKVLLVFTDNTDRTSGSNDIDPNSWYAKEYGEGLKYPTQTAAVVRGLDNARPLSTQRWYHEGAKGAAGRWTDEDFDEFKKVIDKEIADILAEWNTGKYETIWFPRGGVFNTKISNISRERTPKLYRYLQEKLVELVENVDGVNNNQNDNLNLSEKEQEEARQARLDCETGGN